MILIDGIHFGYTKLYSDGNVVQVRNDDVVVNYVFVQDGNEIEGKLTIDFDEFKRMNHDELLIHVKNKFNKTIKAST